MSPSSTTRSPRRKRIISTVKLDELLAGVEKHTAIINIAKEKKDAAIKVATDVAEALYEEEVGEAPGKLSALHEELASFLVRRRYTLMNRLGKTIERPMGVIKFTHNAPEMDWPKNETAVVRGFESRSDGLKYLTVKTVLNKKAILQAPPEVLAAFRSLGVWRGKHLHISLKTPSMKESFTLARRRYNEKPLRKNTSK